MNKKQFIMSWGEDKMVHARYIYIISEICTFLYSVSIRVETTFRHTFLSEILCRKSSAWHECGFEEKK